MEFKYCNIRDAIVLPIMTDSDYVSGRMAIDDLFTGYKVSEMKRERLVQLHAFSAKCLYKYKYKSTKKNKGGGGLFYHKYLHYYKLYMDAIREVVNATKED